MRNDLPQGGGDHRGRRFGGGDRVDDAAGPPPAVLECRAKAGAARDVGQGHMIALGGHRVSSFTSSIPGFAVVAQAQEGSAVVSTDLVLRWMAAVAKVR